MKVIKQIYYFCTRQAESSLLGLLAGMVSGAAINIMTGQNLSLKAILGVALLTLTVVALIILIYIRQNIDHDYNTLGDLSKDKKTRWQGAADWGNKLRMCSFFLFSIIAIISCLVGINFIYQANKETALDQISNLEKNNEGQKITIITLRADSVTTHQLLNRLTDSLTAASTRQNVTNYNKRK